MRKITSHLDPWSIVVLVITMVLFVFALFTKGFTHDLLLEAGVFLVSVKLIIMAFKNSTQEKAMEQKLQSIQSTLYRIEKFLSESAVQSGGR